MLTHYARGRAAVVGTLLVAVPAVDLLLGLETPELMHLVSAVMGFLLLAAAAKA